MVKRLLFLFAVLALALSWSPSVAASDCGYYNYQVSGGTCTYSWCGSSCHATDCVYSNGGEYHSISQGCGANTNIPD
jgi:hypothetical protein